MLCNLGILKCATYSASTVSRWRRLMISIRSSNSRRTVAIQRSAIKDAGELGVAIPDQERETRHTVVEVHQKIARLLSDPGAGGVRGDAEEVDAAGGVLHDEQHLEPLQQHRIDAEEVGSENAVCLARQELPSGRRNIVAG